MRRTSEISKARPLEIQLPLRYKNGARAGSVQLCMWWKPGGSFFKAIQGLNMLK